MKSRKTLIALLALIFSSASFGVEVKGLELGQVTSLQALANNFGNASCPNDLLSPTNTMRKSLYESIGFTCNVPISYLGIKTSADVSLSLQWVVKDIEIKIPYELLSQVETYLTKQYGNPDVIRKSKRIIDFKKQADGTIPPPVNYSEPCSDWNNLEQVDISLCERALSGPSSYVKFRYKVPKSLDETDI